MTASVTLTLDTRAPALVTQVTPRATPPDPILLTVTSDEEIGIAAMALLDSAGTLTTLGHSRPTPYVLEALVPSLGLPGGGARVLFSVADEVLNMTHSSVATYVDRPRAFDVDLDLGGAFDLDLTLGEGFGVDVDLHRGFHTSLGFF